MSCDAFLARLDELVDGDLDAAEERRLREHLAGCASCRAELETLKRLLADAARLPRTLATEADLWPAIRRRLVAPRRAALGRAGGWGLAAAAALCCVLLTLGLRYRAGSELQPSTPETAVVPTEAETEQLAAEQAFREARSELLARLHARRGELAPETLAVVEENLAIIETSLGRIRSALEEDPANQELRRLLIATYRSELELLRQAAGLGTPS